jgi:DNA-binding transcriptional ArsR family regulator
MPGSTWATVEVPVMAAIADRAPKPGHPGPFSEAIIETTGLDGDQVTLALDRLYENGYVTGSRLHNAGTVIFANLHLTERGLREAGVWPSGDPFDALVRVLTEKIASEPDEERAGHLRRLLSAVIEAGRDVAVDVIAKVIAHGAGV